MGIVGLTKVLDDKEYACLHPEENQTAHHVLENTVVASNVSSIFTDKGAESNGYLV